MTMIVGVWSSKIDKEFKYFIYRCLVVFLFMIGFVGFTSLCVHQVLSKNIETLQHGSIMLTLEPTVLKNLSDALKNDSYKISLDIPDVKSSDIVYLVDEVKNDRAELKQIREGLGLT